jgi:hypothetical protein
MTKIKSFASSRQSLMSSPIAGAFWSFGADLSKIIVAKFIRNKSKNCYSGPLMPIFVVEELIQHDLGHNLRAMVLMIKTGEKGLATITPHSPPGPSCRQCSSATSSTHYPSSSWSARGPWRKGYPSCLCGPIFTLNLIVAFELPEEEEDEDLELVHHLLVLQQFLHGVVYRPTQGVLDLFVGNTSITYHLLFSKRLTIVWMLRSVVKVDSISLTSPSLTSAEATTSTSAFLMACWTSWSESSPRASCLLLPCSDWIAYYVHTYMKCPFCRADTSRCRMSSTNFCS